MSLTSTLRLARLFIKHCDKKKEKKGTFNKNIVKRYINLELLIGVVVFCC